MFQNLELNSLFLEAEISNLKHQFGVLLEPRPTAHGFWQNSVSVNRLFNIVLKFPNKNTGMYGMLSLCSYESTYSIL